MLKVLIAFDFFSNLETWRRPCLKKWKPSDWTRHQRIHCFCTWIIGIFLIIQIYKRPHFSKIIQSNINLEQEVIARTSVAPYSSFHTSWVVIIIYNKRATSTLSSYYMPVDTAYKKLCQLKTFLIINVLFITVSLYSIRQLF